jgi:hypothetical protein
MTKYTKKRPTGHAGSESEGHPSASERDPPTLAELLERNAQLERRLKKYKGQFNPSVSPILTI